MSAAISCVSRRLRSASFRTSSATTAKPSRVPCACRLDGSVQGEEVRLLSKVVNRLDDRTDLLPKFTEFGNPIRRSQHDIPNLQHRIDGVPHGISTCIS